jgi:hypothetical protein
MLAEKYAAELTQEPEKSDRTRCPYVPRQPDYLPSSQWIRGESQFFQFILIHAMRFLPILPHTRLLVSTRWRGRIPRGRCSRISACLLLHQTPLPAKLEFAHLHHRLVGWLAPAADLLAGKAHRH